MKGAVAFYPFALSGILVGFAINIPRNNSVSAFISPTTSSRRGPFLSTGNDISILVRNMESSIISPRNRIIPQVSSASIKLIMHALPTRESFLITNQPTPSQISSLATDPSHIRTKSGSWSEYISSGATATRYIIRGSGSLTFTPLKCNEEDDNENIGIPERNRIRAGSFVECSGPGQLVWDVDEVSDEGEEGGMKILYSGRWISEEDEDIVKVIAGVLVGVIAVGSSSGWIGH
ncbi:hypothetical protein ACHAXS_006426 [Conticribra weissflogii]